MENLSLNIVKKFKTGIINKVAISSKLKHEVNATEYIGVGSNQKRKKLNENLKANSDKNEIKLELGN